MTDFYTVEQAAQALQKSRGWVYRHASALGAFQPQKGCALFIPASVIEAIKRGSYAIPATGRQMESAPDDRRQAQDKDMRHEGASKSMGGNAKRKGLDKRSGYADPYGLLA
jgi:hypothetical protein